MAESCHWFGPPVGADGARVVMIQAQADGLYSQSYDWSMDIPWQLRRMVASADGSSPKRCEMVFLVRMDIFFVFSMMFSWSVSLNYFHNWRQWEEEEQKISRNQLISADFLGLQALEHAQEAAHERAAQVWRYDRHFSVTCHHIVTLSLTCLWPQVLRERRMLVPKPLSLSQVPWRFLKYCGVRIAVKKTLLKQKQRNACRTQKTSKLLFLLFPKNALRY